MNLFLLDKPKAYESQYLKNMRDGLKDRIINGVGTKKKYKLSDAAKKILLPNWNTANLDMSNIERLLIAEPEELIQLNNELMKKLKKLCFGKAPSNELLLKIFNYEGIFDDSSKKRAFELSKIIGTQTCCYCNRQYTFTVEHTHPKQDKQGNWTIKGAKNKDERIARPAFDHWFPKSEYPLLSLSLYNLIPSCHICNSSAKGSTPVNLDDYIHPYVHNPGHPEIKFKAVPSVLPNMKWTIKIERPDGSAEDNTIKLFCLDDIYKLHDSLEVKDIMDFKDNYPEGYIADLMNRLRVENIGGSLTQKDVFRMLFGIEYDEDKVLLRPLGKMKRDLIEELVR